MLCSVIRREVGWGVLHQVLVQLGLGLSKHIYSCSLAHVCCKHARHMYTYYVEDICTWQHVQRYKLLMFSSKFEYVHQTRVWQKDMST